ncbi:MAG: CRTAC1 family protein [Planctomycetota bacterium]|nr:CRTAC1 family protein [Planctomycetota bacterium]
MAAHARASTRAPLYAMLLAVLVACPLIACKKTSSAGAGTDRHAGAPWFEEVALESKVDFVHASGHRERLWFPEIMAGGVALFDYDNDGDLDLYLVQSGDLNTPPSGRTQNRLYRNLGDATFEDVTAVAGVGDTGYGVGCTCGDFNGDGAVDLYVTNVGPNVLYQNEGDGTFTDVTARAGVGDPAFSTSAAFVDYDADGNTDLFVANYVVWSHALEVDCRTPDGRATYCGPSSYTKSTRDTLYRNLGNGKFANVTASAGLGGTVGTGLGVVCADFDNDHGMDLYVANDGMVNRLWINDGHGRFRDRALISGCASNEFGASEAGMGVAAVDFNHDGALDLFISHLRGETNTFYLNTNGFFEDATSTVGLALPSRIFTGFGCGFADFDHDTIQDLYVANGRVVSGLPREDPDDPYAEPNQLFRGLPGMRFEEVRPRGGTLELLVSTSRGAAFGDLDNDGDIDVVVVNKDSRPYLLRNIVGHRGNWIMFRVLQRGNQDAVGAMVRLDFAGLSRWRLVQPAYSYCAGNDPRIHCGLGAATQVDRVTVRWPDGGEEAFGPFVAGRHYELRKGSGR